MSDVPEGARPERRPSDNPFDGRQPSSAPFPPPEDRPRREFGDDGLPRDRADFDPRRPRSEREEFRGAEGFERSAARPAEFDPRDPRARARMSAPAFEEEDEEYDEEYEDQPQGRWAFLQPRNIIPWFMEQPKNRKILIAAGALIVVIVILSIVANGLSALTAPPTEEPEPEQTQVVEQPEQPEPTEPPPPPPAQNEWEPALSAEVGGFGVTVDGMRIEIRDIECDVVAEDRSGGVVESELGSWCVANFAAKNVSNDILTISSERFSVLDIFGEEEFFGHYRFGDVGGGNVIVKLVPNESTAGFVYFEVPIGTQVSQLAFTTFGNVGGTPVIFENLPVRENAGSSEGETESEQQEGETAIDSVVEENN